MHRRSTGIRGKVPGAMMARSDVKSFPVSLEGDDVMVEVQ